jgi:hypothetical protein
LGNNLVNSTSYNSRLQPNAIKLGTASAPTLVLGLFYDYGTTNNNGNVLGITASGGGVAFTQTCIYDALNRLVTAQEAGSWSQTNGYDRCGNRWMVKPS